MSIEQPNNEKKWHPLVELLLSKLKYDSTGDFAARGPGKAWIRVVQDLDEAERNLVCRQLIVASARVKDESATKSEKLFDLLLVVLGDRFDMWIRQAGLPNGSISMRRPAELAIPRRKVTGRQALQLKLDAIARGVELDDIKVATTAFKSSIARLNQATEHGVSERELDSWRDQVALRKALRKDLIAATAGSESDALDELVIHRRRVTSTSGPQRRDTWL